MYPQREVYQTVPLCMVPHHIEAKAFVNRQILQETHLSIMAKFIDFFQCLYCVFKCLQS